MKLQADNTAALIIDFQERLVPAMYDGARAVARTALLLRGFSLLGVPVFVTRQYPKGLGDTVPEIKDAAGAALVFDKLCFDCCEEPEILSALKASGRGNIVVCGFETHICVAQTAAGLARAGFTPVLPRDCTSSRFESDRDGGFLRISEEGAFSASAESVLFELVGRAGSDAFKAVSKLVK